MAPALALPGKNDFLAFLRGRFSSSGVDLLPESDVSPKSGTTSFKPLLGVRFSSSSFYGLLRVVINGKVGELSR